MQIIEINEYKRISAPISIILGNFDGVHRGHQALIQQCVQESRLNGWSPSVLLLDPHPALFLKNKTIKLINSIEQKTRLLADLGIENIIKIPFNNAFAKTTPEKFVKHYLVDCLQIKKAFVGFNYTFGSNGQGNPDMLTELGKNMGFLVHVMPPFYIDGEIVSSTAVRLQYQLADMKKARILLGYWPTIEGIVTSGDKRGRTMGFPTANIAQEDYLLTPSHGVYAAFSEYKGTFLKSVVNIGVVPTFNNTSLSTIEAHYLDFKGDLYGETLQLHLVQYLRPEKKFENKNELEKQIKADITASRIILANKEIYFGYKNSPSK